jgi:1-deoxy-D-xylulose-5-phosphate synthase
MMDGMDSFLDNLQGPDDIKRLGYDQLEVLAAEVRERIVATVSRNGGHLAANLGTVELTLALLRVFDPPEDQVVWDVGHQTYAWKLLTGRADRFHTLRKPDGLSGFPRRDESPFDAYGGGHAGTALSAALGLAVARDRAGGKEHVVAVVGDAAMGNGISFEALNNVAGTAKRLIVVLNDNEMSISGNVGALSRYLGRLLTSRRYNVLKARIEYVAHRLHLSFLQHVYHRVESAIKSLFVGNVLFEEFGLRYIGPVDGHNLPHLAKALRIARDYDRPILVHVSTHKGHGYTPAECAPERWHGVGPFNAGTGELSASKPGYSHAFGEALSRLAGKDRRIVAITAAMRDGTGLARFAERFPDRFFDTGICEEHAAVFAAGLAAAGMRPVVALYSTFMQRAVDAAMHDVCLQNLPVVFCLDRAGVVGADGPTHHGVFDIPMLRALPNLTVMQPADEPELAGMLGLALSLPGPSVIRYPRDRGPGLPLPETFAPPAYGTAEVVAEPPPPDAKVERKAPSPLVWLWALGDMLPLAGQVRDELAGHGVRAGIVNARFLKPLDGALLAEQAKNGAPLFATFENGAVAGGFGSALSETLDALGIEAPVLRFGWPDRFQGQGPTDLLRERAGLSRQAIAGRIRSRLAERDPAATAPSKGEDA